MKLPPNGTTPWLGAPTSRRWWPPANDFAAPAPLDLVWLSDNYHDLHDPFFAPADLAKVNAAVFNALKPGGVYLVVDHAAPAGSGLADTNTLHRIDEAAVKSEVGGGRVPAGRRERRAAATRRTTAPLRIFDPAIRGRTDQFVLRFRKPR